MKTDNKNEELEISQKLLLPSAKNLEDEMDRIKGNKEYVKLLVNTISSLIVVAAIAVLIATFILPVLRVTGNSMTPTLESGTVIVCKKTKNFKRGDVVAFYYNNKVLLKRIIGMPGDTIDIRADGTVLVNNEEINEPYIDEAAYGECNITLPYQVPDERYFVMGDHRATSVDSRTKEIGCVAEESILGKIKAAIWPLNKVKWLDKK